MTTTAYQVLLRGRVLGYVAHQDTAGVWMRYTCDSWEGAWRNTSGRECTCKENDMPMMAVKRCWRVVGENGEAGQDSELVNPRDTVWLLWCPTCRAVVFPPFDGYDTHEYGCCCGKCSGGLP